MVRLTREQSQALTREKLLRSAIDVVARDGYEGASVERIAEEAGFSKGAFYSNFASKEDILLQLLESNTGNDVRELHKLLEETDDAEKAIEIVMRWSDSRAAEQKWGIIAIEFLRRARRDNTLDERHRQMFVQQWQGIGQLLLDKIFRDRQAVIDARNLGGIVLELTYGGISGFININTAGEMVGLTLMALRNSSSAACSKKIRA